MADLDVQPKRSNPWWLWLLIAIIAIAILIFLMRGCNNKTTEIATTDSTTTTKTTDNEAVAVTKPDWDKVDFNSAPTKDADVTDPAIVVSGKDEYIIYTLGENILFATDQNALQGDAGAKLQQIAGSIKKRFGNANIGVYGSTDSTGTAGHNKMLGAERAEAVKNWLVTTGGIDSGKVSVRSLGETKPVATNATASGREQNRNVSIVAFPNK